MASPASRVALMHGIWHAGAHRLGPNPNFILYPDLWHAGAHRPVMVATAGLELVNYHRHGELLTTSHKHRPYARALKLSRNSVLKPS